VSNTANDDLRDTVKKLCDSVSILSDRLGNLENAIATGKNDDSSEATASPKKLRIVA
jgi:hypothetical protein